MNLELGGKVVLITGGASGIGESIARTAVAEGAIAVIVDRCGDAALQLKQEFDSRGGTAEAIVLDLCAAENCRLAVERAIDRFGRLDVLVNNAGFNDKVGLERGDPPAFVASLERNLLHYFNMAHYALPHLRRSRGAIVNIASKTAVTGQGGTSGYASAKGAILALTREWAVELLNYGIRVNAVVPAEVMTPLYRNWLNTFPDPGERLAAILARIPLGKRMSTAEDIANAAVFLMSGKAGHITGQHVFVDGGYVHLDRALDLAE